MRRRLFIFCSAVSLLLCAAACAMWVRSYDLMDRVRWRDAGGWAEVYTARGHVAVNLFLTDTPGRGRRDDGVRYERDAPRPPFNWLLWMGGSRGDVMTSRDWAGFAWHERRNTRLGRLHAVAYVPFWFVALATGALPAAWAATWRRRRGRRRRRLRRGRCPACGYDIRGTPAGGDLLAQCPECGVAPRPPQHERITHSAGHPATGCAAPSRSPASSTRRR